MRCVATEMIFRDRLAASRLRSAALTGPARSRESAIIQATGGLRCGGELAPETRTRGSTKIWGRSGRDILYLAKAVDNVMTVSFSQPTIVGAIWVSALDRRASIREHKRQVSLPRASHCPFRPKFGWSASYPDARPRLPGLIPAL